MRKKNRSRYSFSSLKSITRHPEAGLITVRDGLANEFINFHALLPPGLADFTSKIGQSKIYTIQMKVRVWS